MAIKTAWATSKDIVIIREESVGKHKYVIEYNPNIKMYRLVSTQFGLRDKAAVLGYRKSPAVADNFIDRIVKTYAKQCSK